MFSTKLFKQKSFIKQFTAYFTLLIVTVSIVGIMIYYVASGIIEEEAEKFYLTMANSIKNGIDSRFDEFNKLNIQLSRNRLFGKVINMRDGIDFSRISMLDFLTMYDELSALKSVNSFIDEIFVYLDNAEIVITPTGKEKADYFFKHIFIVEDENKFNLAMLKQNDKASAFIPNLKVSYLGRNYESIIYLQGIISSYNNNYKASLFILTKKSSIEELLRNSTEKGVFDLFIINENNEIILSQGKTPYEASNSNYFYKGYNCTLKDRRDGNEYIIYHIPSSIEGIEYVAVAPLSIVTRKVRYFQEIFLMSFILAIIFALLMILFITKKSLDPLKKLIFNITKDSNYGYNSLEGKSEFEFIEDCIENLKYERNLMESDLKKYNYLQKNNLLVQLTKGNIFYNESNYDLLKKHEILFPYTSFKVAIFEVEDMGAPDESQGSCLNSELMMVIKQMIGEVLDILKYSCYVFESELHRIIVLINFNGLSNQKDLQLSQLSDEIENNRGTCININNILRKIKEEIENKFDIVITIGIGASYNHYLGISKSYEDAIKALNFKLIKGKSSVIEYSDVLSDKENINYYYPLDKELALIEGLKNADFDKVNNILELIINENLHKQIPKLEISKFLFYDLQATAIKALQELNLSNLNNNVISKDLANLNTFDEMIEYIKNIYSDICEEIKLKNNNFNEELINKILNYIDENYTDSNFSLSMCASKFELSNSYLSRFFKEKTGLYFSDYLNKKRLEKAKEHLIHGNKTIKDIAADVGFINDVTFRRVFKKYELVTPVKFKEDNIKV